MVEGQVVRREVLAAILAGEAVAQKDVEPGEGRRRAVGMNSFSEMTEGSFISKDGLRTTRS